MVCHVLQCIEAYVLARNALWKFRWAINMKKNWIMPIGFFFVSSFPFFSLQNKLVRWVDYLWFYCKLQKRQSYWSRLQLWIHPLWNHGSASYLKTYIDDQPAIYEKSNFYTRMEYYREEEYFGHFVRAMRLTKKLCSDFCGSVLLMGCALGAENQTTELNQYISKHYMSGSTFQPTSARLFKVV